MNKIIFITGGARSGKSTFAENLALEIYNNSKDKQKIAYIATGVAFNNEFKKRISAHQKSRNKIFKTYEEDIYINKQLKKIFNEHKIFLVECLTTWLGNLFHNKKKNIINESAEIIDEIIEIFKIKSLKESLSLTNNLILKEKNKYSYSIKKLMKNKNDKILIIISNELGMGIVPENKIARDFRDMQGKINQKVADKSQYVYITCSGIPVRIK